MVKARRLFSSSRTTVFSRGGGSPSYARTLRIIQMETAAVFFHSEGLSLFLISFPFLNEKRICVSPFQKQRWDKGTLPPLSSVSCARLDRLKSWRNNVISVINKNLYKLLFTLFIKKCPCRGRQGRRS